MFWWGQAPRELVAVTLGSVHVLREPSHRRGALLTGAVSVVWILLARRSPELHYHFAPIIAATIWPLSLRSRGQRDLRVSLEGAIGAGVLTMLTTLGLRIAGYLDGPNFLHRGPAWPEALLFAVLGAAIGAWTAHRRRPGILGSLVDSTV
jgi:hypothetical protein